jgi:S-DNA-T family DNA segregation ATPase FtsK/SpoIIIE
MNSDVHDAFTETVAMVLCTVAVVVIFLWRRPKLVGFLVLSAALWWSLQVPGVLALVVVVGLVLGVWRLAGPRSFRRLVSGPLARGRRRRRYRRSWPQLAAVHRLSWAPHPRSNLGRQASYWELLFPANRGAAPKLKRVRIGDWVDRLEVRMLPGQTPAEWDDAAEALAHTVGARDV